MKLLAIETSCDETAVALLECEGGSRDAKYTVLGNALYSQASKHAEYGGVFPSLAKREHAKNLTPLLSKCLADAGDAKSVHTEYSAEVLEQIRELLVREEGLADALIRYLTTHNKPTIDAIAVTRGPGLEPALWVGVNFARALSLAWGVEIIPVNHMEGHMVSGVVSKTEEKTFELHGKPFPLLALLISGGHTEIVHATSWGAYTILGSTRDDAAGEAYDKVARLLGLPYPGGKHISDLADKDRRTGHSITEIPDKTPIVLPRPMLDAPNYDFSFSGLKTAALYLTQKLPQMTPRIKQKVAREFDDAVTEVLVGKLKRALGEYEAKSVVLGGGVSASKHIQREIASMLDKLPGRTPDLLVPAEGLTGDNAVMIGMAGYVRHMLGIVEEIDGQLAADGALKL